MSEEGQPLAAARLCMGRDSAAPAVYRIAAGNIALYSARCPGKRTANEDAAAILPLEGAAAVLAVADGVGGMPNGAQASEIAIRSLHRALEQSRGSGRPLRAAILDGIEQANRTVLESAAGAATTLAVVEIDRDSVRHYHVGDSTILLTGQRGRIKLQNLAHSPVGFAVESGLLDEGAALHHQDRHLVSNVIGSTDMRIEMGSRLPLAPLDSLLLASDGLSDNMHLDEIVEGIRKGALQQAAGQLVALARTRMRTPVTGLPSAPDDLTVLLFRPHRPIRRRSD